MNDNGDDDDDDVYNDDDDEDDDEDDLILFTFFYYCSLYPFIIIKIFLFTRFHMNQCDFKCNHECDHIYI